MATFYRCDVCEQVDAERTVPDSWRTITINEDEDSTEGKYLACTACITAFHNFVRERKVRPTKEKR